MTDDQSQPPSEAEREELRTAIDELMRGPVAVYQPRLPTWAERA
jgi:hypothetical protein